MKLKIVSSVIILFFFQTSGFSQCAYTGTPLTQAGTTKTFTIDNTSGSSTLINNVLTVNPVNAGQYVLVNVIMGYSYTFSIGDVFSGSNENLTIKNAVTNLDVSPSAFNSGNNGTSISNWVSTISGQIKVLLSKDTCSNDNSVGGTMTLTMNSIGDTSTFATDLQTANATDSWVGHIYNYAGGGSPGGSPATLSSTTSPFLSANYAGYYTVGTENFTENFSTNPFPVYSNGAQGATINTDTFAVRYRMKTSKTGCYLVDISGDDGVRLYHKNNLIFSDWSNHGSNTYGNLLVNLAANDELVFDYYEDGGGNSAVFSIKPFDITTNTITVASNAVCSNTSAVLDGSSYKINGATNSTLGFQWQSSSSSTGPFTNISGATAEDYTTVPIVVGAGVTSTTYYRRVVTGTTASSCSVTSAVVGISTSDCGTVCTYTGTPLSSIGTYTLCIDSAATPTVVVNAGQYALVNVIKGYNYSFSIGDIFAGANESLTLFDASTNVSFGSSGFLTGYVGLTLFWTSTISGQIKVLLSKGACINDGSTGGVITLKIVSAVDTLAADSQTANGNDNWVGHIYNYSGGASPGGNPSPTTLSTTTSPFLSTNYVGYYTKPTAAFTENFGGSYTCTPVFSNGVQRATMYTDTFAVRYRMNNLSRVGCYLVNFSGVDDGIRLYYDGNLIFDRWYDQGSTTYNNVFVNLASNKELVFDYYENAGGNINNISFTPFDNSTNTIITPANVCSGGSTIIDASSYLINGITNPYLTFQWQSSPDGTTGWANILGATSEDYTTVGYVPASDDTKFYRRIVTPISAPSCALTSATVAVKTFALVNPTYTSTQPGCPLPTGSITITNTFNTGDTYSFDNGATYQSSKTKTGLTAATYTIKIKNVIGCVSTGTIVSLTNATPATFNGTAWTPATPNNTMVGTVTGSGTISNVDLCTCTINTGLNVIVTGTMKLQDFLAVNSSSMLTFNDGASLVQINDVLLTPNSGNITYIRSTSAKRYDYTYWSSPVAPSQTLRTIFPTTLLDKYITFDSTLNKWVYSAPTTDTMLTGKGYAVRGPQAFSTTIASAFDTTFVGVPNNGNITAPGTTVANIYNLVGNPYPSAIDALAFVTANSTYLTGTVYFWAHNSLPVYNPSTGRYDYTTNNDYASFNGTGGIAAGTGGAIPTGKIAAGQAFFVKSTATGGGTITFNNSMRSSTYANNQFFRGTTSKKATTQNGRVWINMSNTNGVFKQLLVGYVDGATNTLDNFYDGESFNANGYVNFYSINESKNLGIQGRTAPFVDTDEVPLGYSSTVAEPMEIAIEQTDGTLSNQKIYLEDKKLNVIQDLTQGKYVFSPLVGAENDRFVLKYATTTLGTTTPELNNNVLIYTQSKQILVDAFSQNINKVLVYDMLGRLIYEQKTNKSQLTIDNVVCSGKEVLIVKVILENGGVKSQKLIF